MPICRAVIVGQFSRTNATRPALHGVIGARQGRRVRPQTPGMSRTVEFGVEIGKYRGRLRCICGAIARAFVQARLLASKYAVYSSLMTDKRRPYTLGVPNLFHIGARLYFIYTKNIATITIEEG